MQEDAYPAKHPAIPILSRRIRQIRIPSRNHAHIINSNIAAHRDTNHISPQKAANHLRRGAPKRGVRRHVFLMARRRRKKRRPVRIRLALVSVEEGSREADRRDGSPGVEMVLCVPGYDAGVGKGVVELRVELCGLKCVVGERGADG